MGTTFLLILNIFRKRKEKKFLLFSLLFKKFSKEKMTPLVRKQLQNFFNRLGSLLLIKNDQKFFLTKYDILCIKIKNNIRIRNSKTDFFQLGDFLRQCHFIRINFIKMSIKEWPKRISNFVFIYHGLGIF